MSSLSAAYDGYLRELREKVEQVETGELAGMHDACKQPVMQQFSQDLCNWFGTFLVQEDLRRNGQPFNFRVPDLRALSAAELVGFLSASRALARNAVSARAEDLLWLVFDIGLAHVVAKLADGEDLRAAAGMN